MWSCFHQQTISPYFESGLSLDQQNVAEGLCKFWSLDSRKLEVFAFVVMGHCPETIMLGSQLSLLEEEKSHEKLRHPSQQPAPTSRNVNEDI